MEKFICTFPGKPRYISLPRLMISGAAMNYGADVDTLEDFKILVSELCNLAFSQGNQEITLKGEGNEHEFFLTVFGVFSVEKKDEQGQLSLNILEALGDGMRFTSEGLEVRKAMG